MLKIFANGIAVDKASQAQAVIDYVHHKIHDGEHFFVLYSVADLGAMATPDDMITLTFTTPDTTKWGHFVFEAHGDAGWRVRMIEAPTGGAETQTEQLAILNSNRNSAVESALIALDSTANEVSYDATLATGGITLIDEYIEGASQGIFTSSGRVGARDEIVLKQNTKYQISLFGVDNNPGCLKMSWYEDTNVE